MALKHSFSKYGAAAYRTARRTFPYVASHYAGRAIKYGQKKAEAYVFRGNRSRTQRTFGVTRQHDFANKRSYGRMSKSKKKKLRFAKKVTSAALSLNGTKTAYFSLTYIGTSSVGQQTVSSVCVAGNQLTGSNGYEDIYHIRQQDGNTVNSTQVQMLGFWGEIEMVNVGETNIIMDVYKITNRIPILTNFASVQSKWAAELTSTETPQAGVISPTALSTTSQFGLTPYQCTKFLSDYKILEKTRYLIGPDSPATFTVRNTRPWKLDGDSIDQFSLLKQSVMYMFIARGVSDDTTQATACSYRINYNRSYTYKREGNGSSVPESKESLGLLPNT